MVKLLAISIIVSGLCAHFATAQTTSEFFPERATLIASDGNLTDQFGYSVSISGNTMICSSPLDDDLGGSSGSAYIFEKQADGLWLETAKLIPIDGATGDNFGNSVFISGNTVVCGAPDDDVNGSFSGSAYVFEKQGDGTWLETAKLIASDGAANDAFGSSVSVFGDTIVSGAYRDNPNGVFSGSAYVFEKQPDGAWLLTTKLTASDGAANDAFGFSVSVFSDTIVCSAHLDDPNGINSGSAYIFEKQPDGSWLLITKLIPSDSNSSDNFGWSVSIFGDTAICGANLDDVIDNNNGSAYIFEKQPDESWLETAKLTANDGTTNDQFGVSVSIFGDTAICGASYDDENGLLSGSAYIFEKQADGSWFETAKLIASDASANDFYGHSVSLSDDSIVVGAYFTSSMYVNEMATVLNLETGNLTSDLTRAVSDALPYDRLAVRDRAFDVDGILSFTTKPLTFVSVEQISTSNTLMLVPASGTVFDNSADIGYDSPFSLGGELIAPIAGVLYFANLNVATGGELFQNGAQLLIQDTMINKSGVAYLSGEILASTVQTDLAGTNLVSADTNIYADYLNNGTTRILQGILYVYGSLTNNGILLGTVDTGPAFRGGNAPIAGDGMNIGGNYTIGIDATLRMIDFGWTLRVGGNLDCAINDNTRFNMIGATIAMTGLGTPSQTFELMSADLGAVIDGLDPLLPNNYPVGTLGVQSGTTVTLVDLHDNANDGQATCEALYVENLYVQAGCTLITNGCPVYAVNTVIDGTVVGPITPIADTPACLGDIALNDGLVNVHDLLSLIAMWGTVDQTADINSDGIVNIQDLLILIADWGVCP